MELQGFKKKFHAWWEGYELPPSDNAVQNQDETSLTDKEKEAKASGEKLGRNGKPVWTATRVEVAQRLWGEGYIGPGGEEHIKTLVKPLGLDPSMSVLNIGAGLGGEARDIVSEFDTWVTCFEESKILVKMGNDLSKQYGMAKKAELTEFNYEDFSVNKKYDAVFSKETFYKIHDKGRLIDNIESCLKDKGQLVFTDYVRDEGVPESKDMIQWAATEKVEPLLWTVEQMTEEMSQRNLEVRTNEDFTEFYQKKILYALNEFTKFCAGVEFDSETKIAVMGELDLWAKRVSILGKGVKIVRFYVRKL